jgi:uncharacterized damage-inducible protein DinB
MKLVEQAIQTWEAQRQSVIAQVEDLSEEQLDYRPGEGAKSAREIAIHIAQSQAAVVAEVLSSGSFYRLFDPEAQREATAALPPAETKAELLQLLRVAGEQSTARLRETGELLTERTMQTFNAPADSCLSALWFGVAHEMYHAGQLAVCARAAGRVPTMTQRIDAALGRTVQSEVKAPPPPA